MYTAVVAVTMIISLVGFRCCRFASAAAAAAVPQVKYNN